MSRIANHPPGLNNCSLKDNLQGTPYVQNQSFLNITARMSSYLVTGAGRGLGLEFVRQLSQRPAKQVSVIFATVRGPPSEALQELADESNGRLVILHMVLSDKNSISAAVEQVVVKLAGQGLDVLINNAGMVTATPGGIAAMADLMDVVQVNVENVQNVTSAFLPLLKQGKQKKVMNLWVFFFFFNSMIRGLLLLTS